MDHVKEANANAVNWHESAEFLKQAYSER